MNLRPGQHSSTWCRRSAPPATAQSPACSRIPALDRWSCPQHRSCRMQERRASAAKALTQCVSQHMASIHQQESPLVHCHKDRSLMHGRTTRTPCRQVRHLLMILPVLACISKALPVKLLSLTILRPLEISRATLVASAMPYGSFTLEAGGAAAYGCGARASQNISRQRLQGKSVSQHASACF